MIIFSRDLVRRAERKFRSHCELFEAVRGKVGCLFGPFGQENTIERENEPRNCGQCIDVDE